MPTESHERPDSYIKYSLGIMGATICSFFT